MNSTPAPLASNRFLTIGVWQIGIAVAVLAAVALLFRMSVLPLATAVVGIICAIILTFASLVVLLIGVLGRRPHGANAWVAIVALVLAVALSANFALLIKRAADSPPIHEVSTDTNDPPDFSEVVAVRQQAGATNPPQYERQTLVDGRAINVPEEQGKAYPDIQSAKLRMQPAQAFEAAERAAREMRWDIVASVPAEGRIEATSTSPYLGLKDDIAIRVRADGASSKVDVRSKSRDGASDHGVNAARVRTYLQELTG